jgi:hypothetical protein
LIHEKWTEIKERIHCRWRKFSANDIEVVRDDLDELVTIIRKRYGCATSQAETEYHEFRVSLRPLLQPARR